MTGRLLLATALSSFTLLAQPSSLPNPANRKVDFATDIAPLFRSRCYAGHGAGMQMSSLRLDDGNAALRVGMSGPVINPGHSADSPLVLRIAGGGIRTAQVIGRKGELGLSIEEDPIHVHDLQATILHCLGIDHTR
ncbi:MAG: DUF1501 domain-containing protein, partial [Bryobacteraceae bacterium]